MIKDIKEYLHILKNPEKAFQELKNKSLEDVIGSYMTLLLSLSFAAGIAALLFSLGKSAYLQSFYDVQINYAKMLNYAAGKATAIFFFYLFSGTFLIFILSIIINIFVNLKYTKLLLVLLYATSPLLLFSWIPIFGGALAIWSIFLLTIGIRICKIQDSYQKGTIKDRE